MSTSLLYHTQGIRGFQFQRFDYFGGQVAARIIRDSGTFICPECGSYETTPTYTGTRTIKALPMGSKNFVLQVAMHRIRCHRCGVFKMERLPFLPTAKARVTRSLVRSVIDLRSKMTITDLAKHFNLHWTTIKDIEKNHLKKKFRHIRLRDVRWIGVDEVHTGERMGKKGFITVVRDMKSGAVLHVGRRNIDGITAYWTVGITSASMEGFNNKIRWLNSQAYGYQDEEYFTLKIFDLPHIKTRRDL